MNCMNTDPSNLQYQVNLPYDIRLQSDPRIFPKSQQDNDYHWLNYWLGTKNKKSSLQNREEASLKIYELKDILKKCIMILSKLKTLEKNLQNNVTEMLTSEWKESTAEIGSYKDKLVICMSKISSEQVLKTIKNKLQKRKIKRKMIMIKKSEYRKELVDRLENRQKLNKNINLWLEKMKCDVEKAKQKEISKRNADFILSEVNKKKNDTRKHLALLSSLYKLRSLREKCAVNRGEKVSIEDSRTFEAVINRLQAMWQNAMETYNKEEQELKLQLKENDTNLYSENSFEDWELLLFGPKSVPFDTYWGLTCGERDLGTFIAIRCSLTLSVRLLKTSYIRWYVCVPAIAKRRSWDTFLVSNKSKHGSRLPIGWIIPDNNDKWKDYLNNSK